MSSSFPTLSLSFLLSFLHAPFFLKQFCCNIPVQGTCRIPRGSGASRTPIQGISEPGASSICLLLSFLLTPFFLKQFCCNILVKGTCRIPRGSGASRTPMQGISEPEASLICLLSPLHLFNLLFNLSITNTQLHRLDR